MGFLAISQDLLKDNFGSESPDKCILIVSAGRIDILKIKRDVKPWRGSEIVEYFDALFVIEIYKRANDVLKFIAEVIVVITDAE